ncbi:hypothetical protein ACLK18_02065 [Escherichia coli]
MIDLSVTAGNVLAPPKRWQGTLRDGVSWLLNYLPPVKRYFLEMRSSRCRNITAVRWCERAKRSTLRSARCLFSRKSRWKTAT